MLKQNLFYRLYFNTKTNATNSEDIRNIYPVKFNENEMFCCRGHNLSIHLFIYLFMLPKHFYPKGCGLFHDNPCPHPQGYKGHAMDADDVTMLWPSHNPTNSIETMGQSGTTC